MNNPPCKQCILLAICKSKQNQKDNVHIVNKCILDSCSLIRKYTRFNDASRNVNEFLQTNELLTECARILRK